MDPRAVVNSRLLVPAASLCTTLCIRAPLKCEKAKEEIVLLTVKRVLPSTVYALLGT